MINKVKIVRKTNTDNESPYTQTAKPYTIEDEIQYIWSREPKHLKLYTKLIDKYYENELNLSDVYKNIDYKDLNSDFLIVHHKNELISGARLTSNSKESRASLPNEKLGFSYQELFPELDLENNRYCEISRYTMHTDYRKISTHYVNAFRMFRTLMEKNDVRYLFICSSKARLRLFGNFAKNYLNYVDTRRLGSIEHYSNTNIDFHVLCCELPTLN